MASAAVVPVVPLVPLVPLVRAPMARGRMVPLVPSRWPAPAVRLWVRTTPGPAARAENSTNCEPTWTKDRRPGGRVTVRFWPGRCGKTSASISRSTGTWRAVDGLAASHLTRPIGIQLPDHLLSCVPRRYERFGRCATTFSGAVMTMFGGRAQIAGAMSVFRSNVRRVRQGSCRASRARVSTQGRPPRATTKGDQGSERRPMSTTVHSADRLRGACRADGTGRAIS